MITWQIPAALIGLCGLQMLLSHLRHKDCEDRIETACITAKRNERAAYREAYLSGLVDAKQDRRNKLGEHDT